MEDYMTLVSKLYKFAY